MCGPSRPCVLEPVFLYFISVFLYATWTNVCEGVRVRKQRRRRVVRGVPYPGGVGGPMTRPAPYRSCLRLASIFSKDTRSLGSRRKYFEKTLATFLGTFGGSPRSSPRGRLDFAEGKAGRTSVFVRARALEGREGSQKVIRVLPYYFRKFKMRLRTI